MLGTVIVWSPGSRSRDSARGCKSRGRSPTGTHSWLLSLRRQDDRNPASISRRIRAKIDRDVEAASGEAAHQFPLRRRIGLEMNCRESFPVGCSVTGFPGQTSTFRARSRKHSAGMSRKNSPAHLRSFAGLSRAALRFQSTKFHFLPDQVVSRGMPPRLAARQCHFKRNYTGQRLARSRPARTTG